MRSAFSKTVLAAMVVFGQASSFSGKMLIAMTEDTLKASSSLHQFAKVDTMEQWNQHVIAIENVVKQVVSKFSELPPSSSVEEAIRDIGWIDVAMGRIMNLGTISTLVNGEALSTKAVASDTEYSIMSLLQNPELTQRLSTAAQILNDVDTSAVASSASSEYSMVTVSTARNAAKNLVSLWKSAGNYVDEENKQEIVDLGNTIGQVEVTLHMKALETPHEGSREEAMLAKLTAARLEYSRRLGYRNWEELQTDGSALMRSTPQTPQNWAAFRPELSWGSSPVVHFLRKLWSEAERELNEYEEPAVSAPQHITLVEAVASVSILVRHMLDASLIDDVGHQGQAPGAFSLKVVSRGGQVRGKIFVQIGKTAEVETEPTDQSASRVSRKHRIGAISSQPAQIFTDDGEASAVRIVIPQAFTMDLEPYTGVQSTKWLKLTEAGFQQFVSDVGTALSHILSDVPYYSLTPNVHSLDYTAFHGFFFELLARDWLDARRGMSIEDFATSSNSFRKDPFVELVISAAATYSLFVEDKSCKPWSVLGVHESQSMYNQYSHAEKLTINEYLGQGSQRYAYPFAMTLAALVHSKGNFRDSVFARFHAVSQKQPAQSEAERRLELFFSSGMQNPVVQTILDIAPDLTKQYDGFSPVHIAFDYEPLFDELTGRA